jgi:hypothetical protein
MTADLITWGTTFFLIAFFVFVQVYCSLKSHRGRIKKIEAGSIDQFDLLPRSVSVQLENGMEIQAQASACVLCMGHFSQGDPVQVSEIKGKYTIGLPFLPCRTGKCRD